MEKPVRNDGVAVGVEVRGEAVWCWGHPLEGNPMKPAKNGTQKSRKSTNATGKKSKGFTDEERAAMRERLQELKAEARRGRRADKGDGEKAVLATIAALPQPDR